MRIIKFVKILLFIMCMVINAQTELKHNLDSIIISTNRVPLSFYEIGRNVNILSQKTIEQLPITNIQDLLEQISGVDIKQRGPEGVQADVAIRGGNFEQTLILIDGIKLIDPQTGHHNMNLPISLSQIERVEILKGQGSRIYGANAFSGVINLITKKSDYNNLGIEISGGENNFYNLGINSLLNFGNTFHSISLSKAKSDGYRLNTEFENYNFSINNSFRFSQVIINSIYGYADKDFGANSFYTVRFPNQAEKTETNFASLSADIDLFHFNVTPKLFWRNNWDEFVLNKFNPSFYKNKHSTNSYGSEIQISTNILGGSTSFGFEYSRDDIVSNNLGKNKRTKKGIFFEQIFNLFSYINLSFGGFAYNYSDFGWKLWPGFDLAYSPNNNFKLYANLGKAFRIPTYTELYYSDPITLGNAKLRPEESTNYEIGINFNFAKIAFYTSFFRKEGRNLIDYKLDENDNFWKAENLNKINTFGFEFGAMLNLREFTNNILQQVRFDYTYLSSDKIDLGVTSRYALEYLKHDLTVLIFHNLLLGIIQSWSVNYEDRIKFEDHLIVDTKLMKNFSNIELYLTISNLFNRKYEEIPGVTLPGKWIIGGVKLVLF